MRKIDSKKEDDMTLKRSILQKLKMNLKMKTTQKMKTIQKIDRTLMTTTKIKATSNKQVL